MDDALQASGKVVLYGILFDMNKDTMVAASTPQLKEIAALLKVMPR